MALPAPMAVAVGRLGLCEFPAGLLAYVGSARGPGGLRARLARHLRPQKALCWHVDYLSTRLQVIDVLPEVTAANVECAWTRRLLAWPGASAPIAGFGSSDCVLACPAHLVHLPAGFDPLILRDWLRGEDGARRGLDSESA